MGAFEDWYREEFIDRLKKKGDKPQKAVIDIDFLKRLVEGTAKMQTRLDQWIHLHLNENWDFARMPLVLRYILELALYELTIEKTQKPIVLNEYLEITKDFFAGEEPAFVNSLLDKIQPEPNLEIFDTVSPSPDL
jgi:transcription antitermination factor NusB